MLTEAAAATVFTEATNILWRCHSNKSKALYVAQLDKQKHKNNTLVAELRNVEQKLEGHQVKWEEEKTSLIQATKDLKETVQELAKSEDEAKKTVERSKASHQLQIREQKAENREIASALKNVKHLLETEHLHWQQEKSSLLEEMEKSRSGCEVNLDEQKHNSKTVMYSLNTVKQQLDKHLIEWQEFKTKAEEQKHKNSTLRACRRMADMTKLKDVPQSGHKVSQEYCRKRSWSGRDKKFP
ncbi:moesin-like [Acanthopagrus latus]|uniref:moesin-like n=1 Tax=Acanthopagrus latus TaxID=8177 RepID=UPI00187C120D|nr:moesin-like [Acanthopagrus latus]